jgi:hypothetical protein
LPDRFKNIFGDLSPAQTADLRKHSPVDSESGSMPAYDCFRLDNDQRVAPTLPESTKEHPEQAIRLVDAWSRVFALEYSELLAQDEDFQAKVVARADEIVQVCEECDREAQHWGIDGYWINSYRRVNHD